MKRILLVSVILCSFFLNGYFLIHYYRQQFVVFVPDGDSLELMDGRRVRLLGIDAPEKGRCFHDEARAKLESLVQGKRIAMNDVAIDAYGRQLANVFVGKQFINESIVVGGFARYSGVNSPQSNSIKVAFAQAKDQQLGIFSSLCRSLVPPSPTCTIKGNIKNGDHTYHLPSCPNYSQTIIDLSYGDAWFCTEKEAVAAGFTKASGCE